MKTTCCSCKRFLIYDDNHCEAKIKIGRHKCKHYEPKLIRNYQDARELLSEIPRERELIVSRELSIWYLPGGHSRLAYELIKNKKKRRLGSLVEMAVILRNHRGLYNAYHKGEKK